MPRMGDSKDSSTNVDAAVGTIVWVRRRNGSWWPGRIISDAELSTANLLSPRSGTPVKLLGREDGSVDWYNIEKSKRVKPFRCGDFEECIEKAKAVAGLPTKKREKYARREDAILHALELEKQQFEGSSGFVETSAYRIRDHDHEGEREVSTVDRARSRRRRRPVKTNSSQEESEDSDVYVDDGEDESGGEPSFSGRRHEEQDWNPEEEEEEIEEEEEEVENHRMRGLQDIGLKSLAGKKGRKDQNLQQQSMKAAAIPLNGTRIPASTKKKRSLTGTADEGSLKKRDRRRPMTQVLENSAALAAEHASELMMQVIDDDVLLERTTGLGGMEGMGIQFTSLPTEAYLNSSERKCSVSGARAGDDFPAVTNELGASDVGMQISHRRGCELQPSRRKNEGLTGSRSLPNSTKRSSDKRLVKAQDREEEDVGPQGVASRKLGTTKLGQVVKADSSRWWFSVPVEGGQQKKESVPMVLLASRLTKKPIVGYPIFIEPVEARGSQELEEEEDDEGEDVQISTWRTARRTVRQRVPRQQSAGNGSNKDDDEDDEGPAHEQADRHLVPRKSLKANKNKRHLSKKLVKKVVQSSRKTRTLSSIGQRGGQVDGRILAGVSQGQQLQQHFMPWPVATCVPVRVALGRIKAAIG